MKSSQEINTSTTEVSNDANGHITSFTNKEHYVKLVFERDKNMPNFHILKDNNDKWCKLKNEISQYESSIEKRSKKFYFFFAF